MWKLNRKEDASKMKEALLSMKGKVLSLQNIEVGINISQHNAAYDVVFIGTFLDSKALAEFEADEFHKKVGEIVSRLREHRVVVEYEI